MIVKFLVKNEKISLAKRSPQTDTSILWISFLGVLMVTKKKSTDYTAALLIIKISLKIMQIWSRFIDIRASFLILIYASAMLVSWPLFGIETLFLCKCLLLLLKKTWSVIAREKKGFRTSKSSHFNIYIISTKVKRLLIVFHTSFNTSKAKTPFCSSVFHRASHHHWACKENKVDDFHWSVVETKEVQNWGPRRDWYCCHRWSFFDN